ncbi:hypothetical protein BDV95DRAFT_620775 [Massariosphaeria phaeospora]|uniref:Uncharacterized protein n=1 Tax=Massariosphaeria phaeospora TaxID=100035 RepID=A0A7C8I6N8_9PLEO|nr:hypothetical protein BDV95DRAFT_620775 [Massariosphaeria phaeospora]
MLPALVLNQTEGQTEVPSNRSADSMKYWRDGVPSPDLARSGEIGYIGAVRGRGKILQTTLEGADLTEILFAIQWSPTENKWISDTEYVKCHLVNASVTFRVDATNRVSSIEIIDVVFVELTRYNVLPFVAFFTGLAKYLVDMAQHGGRSDGNRHNMSRTRDISFRDDVEDFALNVSLSFLSDPSLCTHVPVNITTTTNRTVYDYHSKNLIIAYDTAISLSVLSVCLGMYSFFKNGVGHDLKVSTIGAAMQNREVQEALQRTHTILAQPLNKEAEKIELRFDPDKGFVLKPRLRAVDEAV